jgi:hypothetical protein
MVRIGGGVWRARLLAGGIGLVVSVVVVAPPAVAQTPALGSRPTTDWRRFPTVATDVIARWRPTADTVAAPRLSGTGPALQVQTTTPVTLLRTDWTLSGSYATGATFTPDADLAPVEIGVTVGSGALACIVAPDGRARFDARGSTLRVSATAVERTPATQILIRVTDHGIACIVDGHTVLTMSPMPLKGAPGVYLGGPGAVLVAGFTAETAPDASGGR